MRIWIDIANAPHATLFAPISRDLVARGHEVVVTTWDRGLTKDLALAEWPSADVIGSDFRAPLLDKALAIVGRAARLRAALKDRSIDVAVGHNSYAQIVAGRRMRIGVVTMMDYEHQPANHLAFRLAHRVILPRCLPLDSVRRFGLSEDRLIRYDGLKEELTLAGFRPDPTFGERLGLTHGKPVAIVRPAAVGALYHRRDNPLFSQALTLLLEQGATVILTPRTAGQAAEYAGYPGLRVLETPVSGADLLYYADLIVGAGGTMTREAAVLGTPSYSIFAGKPAAVDAELERQGKLVRLSSVDDLRRIQVEFRNRNPGHDDGRRVAAFNDVLLDACRGAVGGRGGRRATV